MNEREGRRGEAPPRLWAWLLGRVLPSEQRDAALGDLAEELAARIARDGRVPARRWYRVQVVRSIPAGLGHAARAAGSWASLNLTNGEGVRMWTNDVRLAIRTLLRRPGFTLTVALTLALGVGATTALFGVYRTVFLEPIPLPESEELVVVMEQGSFGCCGPASGPDYLDWRERNRVFEGLYALNPGTFTLTGADEPERVPATRVTASAFEVLGVEPLMGRALLPEDEEAEGTVVLGYAFWQGQLGGRNDVLGSTLELNDTPYTIVGVMPEGFDVPSPWIQYGLYRFYLPFPRERLNGNRGSHGFPVIARLTEGTTKEAAQEDMDRVMRELAVEYPETNADRSTRLFTVHEYLFGDVGRQLGIILGAAGLVLLIACGNVAGLLLARAAGRETELAVRTALGASRPAMVRLLFSEAAVLAALGAAAGLIFSYAAIDVLRAILPPTIPRIDRVAVDGWALLFGLGASALTALVFGMVPALLASRIDLAGSVKEGGYGTLAPAKERLRNAFIVGQIALGLVLANGATLLVRSYAALRGQDFGFETQGVITLSLNPAGPRYPDVRAVLGFYDGILERVNALPGVERSGMITRLPLNGGSNGNVWVEGRPQPGPGEGPLVEVTSVHGDYFAAMGIPLLRGRLPLPEDSASAAPGVVVNERFVELAWDGEDPIGRRFSFDVSPPEWLTVVGVVGDVRQWGPEQQVQAQMYAPYTHGWDGSAYLTVRTATDPALLVPRIREAVLATDPAQPPADVRTMEERVDRRFAQRRFYTTLIALFAGAALFLAAAGVYGTVSYFVARRLRELGIRMALGAGGTGIMGLVLRRSVRLALWGVAVGLVGVWASTRVVEGLVYGIGTLDLPTLLGGCVLLALVAIAAAVVPALRAVRVPPVLALRSE